MRICRPCAAAGIDRKDTVFAAAATIGSALAVAAIMMVGNNQVTEAIGLTMTPAVLAVGGLAMQLRGKSAWTKALLIGGPLFVTFLIGLVVGLFVSG